MALQDTTKRGKESERDSMPFSLTTSSLAGSRQPSQGGLKLHRTLLADGQGALSPVSSLSPTLGFIPPTPEKILWAGSPSQSPSQAPLLHQGWQVPSGGSPRKMLPKEPDPLELAPPPPQAAQPSLEKEGRKEGLGASRVSQGRGAGVSGESIS